MKWEAVVIEEYLRFQLEKAKHEITLADYNLNHFERKEGKNYSKLLRIADARRIEEKFLQRLYENWQEWNPERKRYK